MTETSTITPSEFSKSVAQLVEAVIEERLATSRLELLRKNAELFQMIMEFERKLQLREESGIKDDVREKYRKHFNILP